MEEHGYGYGGPAAAGGGNQDNPSAGSAAAPPPHPRGWSSLTKLLRNPSPPPRDPFPPLAAATNSSKNRVQHVSTNSGGERSQHERNNNNNQQQQRGVSSPASSTGSFSSNYSGRNHNWGHQADVQAAFSSNATAFTIEQQGLLAAAESPPESSSGSFAPNASIVNHHHTRENHHGHRSRGSGHASSAGSLSLTPYHYRVQSGAYGARRGGFQTGNQVAVNGGEREVSGGAKSGVDDELKAEQGNEHKFSLKRREFESYEVVADDGRRDEPFAGQRNGLDTAKPAVSDGRSSIGDADRDVNCAHEQQGKDAGDSTAASSAFHVPVEPEWEEEDVYLRARSDALKEARARDKFARGASQAYELGDHRKAKALSIKAEEKRLIAKKLHAEAAFEILNQRNRHGSTDIWHLDLHGLHTAEAVAALESRLALLEHGLAEDHDAEMMPSTDQFEKGGQDHDELLKQKAILYAEAGQTQQEDSKHKLFQSLIPASKVLSIVTGVGAHSQGGATLPSAVKTFLISNGYQLEEQRAGVVSVHPKLRFSV